MPRETSTQADTPYTPPEPKMTDPISQESSAARSPSRAVDTTTQTPASKQKSGPSTTLFALPIRVIT